MSTFEVFTNLCGLLFLPIAIIICLIKAVFKSCNCSKASATETLPNGEYGSCSGEKMKNGTFLNVFS